MTSAVAISTQAVLAPSSFGAAAAAAATGAVAFSSAKTRTGARSVANKLSFFITMLLVFENRK